MNRSGFVILYESMFQCSSASRKFLNRNLKTYDLPNICVSVLFSEPKIPQLPSVPQLRWVVDVSVLFSEPKIPQCRRSLRRSALSLCFSALQRAENSSITTRSPRAWTRYRCFSALQRAENSSIGLASVRNIMSNAFQCSSASRKFLNSR